MKLILASQSPRRKFLMKQMGLVFDTVPSGFDEYFDDNRPADEIAIELGLGKAREVADKHPDDLVIGSDLIVVLDGKQLGKPKDTEDAKKLLKSLSGRTHQLVCSVVAIRNSDNYEFTACDHVELTFKDISDEAIEEYVSTGTTMDKAGGYAIQHPMMKPNVANIDGRLDTIIGLPTYLLQEPLEKYGYNYSELELEDEEFIAQTGFHA